MIGSAYPLILLYYYLARPEFSDRLFESTGGWFIIGISLILEIIGIAWLTWLLRIDALGLIGNDHVQHERTDDRHFSDDHARHLALLGRRRGKQVTESTASVVSLAPKPTSPLVRALNDMLPLSAKQEKN